MNHITSVGEISFFFYFTIFLHLQFIAREFENITVQAVFPYFDFN